MPSLTNTDTNITTATIAAAGLLVEDLCWSSLSSSALSLSSLVSLEFPLISNTVPENTNAPSYLKTLLGACVCGCGCACGVGYEDS
jgi:hypothetical protein